MRLRRGAALWLVVMAGVTVREVGLARGPAVGFAPQMGTGLAQGRALGLVRVGGMEVAMGVVGMEGRLVVVKRTV